MNYRIGLDVGGTTLKAGVLVELGAVSIGHTHSNEGGCGNLSCLSDFFNYVVYFC